MEFFLSRPKLLKALGGRLALVSLTIGMLGVLAQIGISAFNNLNTMHQFHPPISWLDEVFPLSLTWWIPESAMGFLLTICLLVAGLALKKLGRDIERWI